MLEYPSSNAVCLFRHDVSFSPGGGAPGALVAPCGLFRRLPWREIGIATSNNSRVIFRSMRPQKKTEGRENTCAIGENYLFVPELGADAAGTAANFQGRIILAGQTCKQVRDICHVPRIYGADQDRTTLQLHWLTRM